MERQSQLEVHICGFKRDIQDLIQQLERLRRGELERDILHQINRRHEVIQALRRSQQERHILPQLDHKHETMALCVPSMKAIPHSFDRRSDATLCLTPSPIASTSAASTSFDSSGDSVLEHSDDSNPNESKDSVLHTATLTASTSLPSFSSFLKLAPLSQRPEPEILVEPNTCSLCGRRCSNGNMWRHRKTCLGRCLDCTESHTVCDDRGRGAPSHECKGCQGKSIPCLYLDKGDGKWKPKLEFANITRFARLARLARKREEMLKKEEDEGMDGGV